MDPPADKTAGADAAGKGKAVSARGSFVYLGEKIYAGLAGRGKEEFFCTLRGQGSDRHEKRQHGKTAGSLYTGAVPGHAERRDGAASP